MAAYEGFLTSIYAGKDVFRPTFFELIAQEQLNEIFQPALRFLVDIFRQRSVSPTLLTLLDSWEVLYTAFRMILEGSAVLNTADCFFLKCLSCCLEFSRFDQRTKNKQNKLLFAILREKTGVSPSKRIYFYLLRAAKKQ